MSEIDVEHFFASSRSVNEEEQYQQQLIADNLALDAKLIEQQRFHLYGSITHPSALDGLPIPPRLWAVQDWVPEHCVTGLYGDGGVGKSLLAMMLMTAISEGLPFLGLNTFQKKCFGFFCEDTSEELHRRQDDINNHYGLEFGQLNNMAWSSRVGLDNVLMSFSGGIGKATPAFEALKENIQDTKSQFIIIDTAADTFGGNENARSEVRQYINMIGGLAQDIDGTVILCAHPSRSGLADETGSGGSTAWNNTLRSRLYLRRPKSFNEENPEENTLRELQKMKSNYSSVGDKLTLKWSNGAFDLSNYVVNDSKPVTQLGGIQKIVMDCLNSMPENPIMIDDLIAYAIKSIPYDDKKRDRRRERLIQSISILQDKNILSTTNNFIYKK